MKASMILMVFTLLLTPLYGQELRKNRVIILTDIEADPDDTQSLVRLLLYSCDIEIRGPVATTSGWHTTLGKPESVEKIIHAYDKVRPNLIKHDPEYPDAGELLSLVRQGLPEYGMAGVGKGKDSEGSELIVAELESDDDRPLWISAWGGGNTLAQALYKIRDTKPPKEARRLVSKLRVYTISDQDDSGIWIRNNFPDLLYIVSPGDDYGSATWSAINNYFAGTDNEEISNGWIAQNIQQGHGAMGIVYPDVAWGMEGDTPSWLGLIPNGLNFPEHPDWGGWGGRYELYRPDFSNLKKGGSGVPHEPETREIWTDAIDRYTPYIPSGYGRAVKPDTVTFSDNKASLLRWRKDFQNDFAARMDWCVMPYAEANHPPVIVLSHPERITVKSGQGFGLDAFNTTDPDGDSFSFLWFCYPEAGSYKKPVRIEGAENAHNAYIIAPKVEKEVTVHFILRVTDRGTPGLSSYKRVIVTVIP